MQKIFIKVICLTLVLAVFMLPATMVSALPGARTIVVHEAIPSTPEYYQHRGSSWFGGAIVHFADAPYTFTIPAMEWNLEGSLPHRITELTFTDGMTLMSYIRGPYDEWTFAEASQDAFRDEIEAALEAGYFESWGDAWDAMRPYAPDYSELFSNPDSVERRNIPLTGLAYEEFFETVCWGEDDCVDDFAFFRIHEDWSIDLPEGVYQLRLSRYSGAAIFLVVGNADTSVLQAYNRATNQAAARTLRFPIDDTTYFDNGTARSLEAAPFIANDRTMVPLRAIIEAFGVTPQFDEGVITFALGGVTHTMTVGQPLADGMGTPVIVADRTFVPLIFVINALDGANARWDDANRVAYVYIY